MPRFRHPLVYLDSRPDSLRALETAAAIARENGAAITVVDVLQPLPAFALPPDIVAGDRALASCDMSDLFLREREQRLQEAIAPLLADGLAVTARVLTGSPFLELVRETLRHGHDLVLKAAEARSRFESVFFGTTAMHLFRKSPVPVWVVGPKGMPARPSRVVVALDPSGDEARDALSAKVLSIALELTDHAGSELHVVRAWSVPGESVLRTTLGSQGLARYAEAAEKGASRSLHAFLERFGAALHRARVHLVPGAAEEAVPHFVASRGGDLLVMGSVGRAGIPGLLIGDAAERILGRVECSVLAVKPDGFVTPVALLDA